MHRPLSNLALAAVALNMAAAVEQPRSLTFPLTKVEARPGHDGHALQATRTPRVLNNEAGDELEVPAQLLSVAKQGNKYVAPLYMGSSKQRALVAFDTGSPYVTVTSDICSNCESKAYQPALSETENNQAARWQLDIAQPGQNMVLKCI